MAQISGVNGVWDSPSDRRLKENIRPLTSALDKVNEIGIYNYAFKHDQDKTKHIGVLAQQLKDIYPELVHEAEGQYGVAYAQLAVVAIQAIKEQQSRIDELRSRVETLKAMSRDSSAQKVQTSPKTK